MSLHLQELIENLNIATANESNFADNKNPAARQHTVEMRLAHQTAMRAAEAIYEIVPKGQYPKLDRDWQYLQGHPEHDPTQTEKAVRGQLRFMKRLVALFQSSNNGKLKKDQKSP